MGDFNKRIAEKEGTTYMADAVQISKPGSPDLDSEYWERIPELQEILIPAGSATPPRDTVRLDGEGRTVADPEPEAQESQRTERAQEDEPDGTARDIRTRMSMDKAAVNQESRQFLRMLEDKGLSVLNGRYAGDTQVEFTCRNHKGASVVDLAMADQRLLPEVVDCEVMPWETPELRPRSRPMSDHRPVKVEILLNQSVEEPEPEEVQQEDQTEEEEDIDEERRIPKFEYGTMPMDTFIEAALESHT